MTRPTSAVLVLSALLLATLDGCAAAPGEGSGPILGQAAHRYQWVANWLQVPGSGDLGNTHGEVVVTRAGQVLLNTDTERTIMVYEQDGRFVRSFGAQFADGLHGMCLAEEDEQQVLWIAQFNQHLVAKLSLDGQVLWRSGAPMVSGVYEREDQFRPTSVAVAPDGRLFVADGYGQQVVHRYDAAGQWLGVIGGPGSEPGRFHTPHGVWVDTRGAEPTLLVADRENHRLQRFDLDGQLLGVIEGMLRRPCKIQQQGSYLVIPDLAGRVTILDGDDRLVTQLCDNPDPELRAVNGVPKDRWRDGQFLAPHSAAWDDDGNLYVMDWNAHGRISKLARVR